ncbi:MAG: protein tyrosine phosphatase [Ramlibacter sp.]|nr:protein tyrosine phosphatase [Ramlibacter sp.]MDB5914526.1 protein tyrosine phosphatase [Ramlibacter sp.]
MKSILVVCEGNICRSPMAEGLLAAALPGVKLQSAGLNAVLGAPADEMAIELMSGRGIDIGAHRARQITRQMCLEADLVFVMEREQRQRLEKTYPEACGRVFRLGEHVGQDVPDPYRQPASAFRTALSIIDDGIGHWVQRIRRL